MAAPPTAKEVLEALRPLGAASYKKVLMTHGIPEPCFGVKISDLKPFQKRIGSDYRLALDLYDSGVYDAMYLAGLIADDAKMTKKDLQRWARAATCAALAESTVPWVTAESAHGHELALEWIGSKQERIASSGWATLSALVALEEDADLDLPELKRLLQRVGKTIHAQPNRVRYCMNSFVIATGCYVKSLTAAAVETARKIGPVTVEMGGTSCMVPDAGSYIAKVKARGAIGKKRKTVRC
jgi:3-methyladenine DNA glycosylase AlkD